jgi:hypothetical protein
VLGALALSSLLSKATLIKRPGITVLYLTFIQIVKRQRENPKRPINIWYFIVWGNAKEHNLRHKLMDYRALDTAKQALAALLVHFSNVFISSFSEDAQSRNPCTFYFLHVIFLPVLLRNGCDKFTACEKRFY